MSLLIAGYTPFSTVDYPGHTAAVVFTQGCPWRCRYCQNPSLQPLEAPQGAPAWGEFLEWLETRRGLLDAVVFSGGEPSAQANLAMAIRDVKLLGFRTGLHTSGAYPDRILDAKKWLDWIGLDVKAPFFGWRYEAITGSLSALSKAEIMARRLRRWNIPHEVRTTFSPVFLPEADLIAIAEDLAIFGVQKWVIQRFQPNSPDPELNAAGPAVVSEELLEQLRSVAPNLNISVR